VIKFEGDDQEWLVIDEIKIPAVVPLSFSRCKKRLYVLPGGIQVTAEWVHDNKNRVVNAFKTHRPKVCEFHR